MTCVSELTSFLSCHPLLRLIIFLFPVRKRFRNTGFHPTVPLLTRCLISYTDANTWNIFDVVSSLLQDGHINSFLSYVRADIVHEINNLCFFPPKYYTKEDAETKRPVKLSARTFHLHYQRKNSQLNVISVDIRCQVLRGFNFASYRSNVTPNLH